MEPCLRRITFQPDSTAVRGDAGKIGIGESLERQSEHVKKSRSESTLYDNAYRIDRFDGVILVLPSWQL
jgi:hypothetical protein